MSPARKPIDPFSLREPSLETVSERLGTLYKNVSVSRDPMFAWVQIANDVTILGEELRRDRKKEAVLRSGKVLMRLLEFVGYYCFVHEETRAATLGNLVAKSLRAPSYLNFLPNSVEGHGLREGPSRWILVKYPYVCSKCGKKPCSCLLYTAVLENRRERPGEYYELFAIEAEKARAGLKADEKHKELSIAGMVSHFRGIYESNYYHQEPWEIGMHLSEELGEATIELSRIALRFNAQKTHFKVERAREEIFNIAKDKLRKKNRLIRRREERETRWTQVEAELANLSNNFKSDPWKFYGNMVGEKFKEEIADVFSWLAAILVKLDPKNKGLKEVIERFIGLETGGVPYLHCPWCQSICKDDCIVKHGVSSEIVEKLSSF